MSNLVSIRVTVHGRVQGVFYRDFTLWHASELGLRGYVRNQPDGTVTVYAEGEKAKLEELVSHLKDGPPSSRVDKLDINWGDYGGDYPGFSVKR